MLVLTRRTNECIRIGNQISIKVLDVRGTRVRLGIDAPDDVPVHRQEVAEAIADCCESLDAKQQCGSLGVAVEV